jgi:hypothetical protein
MSAWWVLYHSSILRLLNFGGEGLQISRAIKWTWHMQSLEVSIFVIYYGLFSLLKCFKL